jgi:hypothetical protein
LSTVQSFSFFFCLIRTRSLNSLSAGIQQNIIIRMAVNAMTMRKIICLLIAVLSLIGLGSAYAINFQAPDELTAGEPMILTGTSTLPSGFSIEIILYQTEPGIKEIERDNIIIQEGGKWSFTFETAGLDDGTYKIEVLEKTAWKDGEYVRYDFSSKSDTLKIFRIIDRSDELKITSATVQNYNGLLDVSGEVEGLGDSGVQITVEGPSGVIFGPEYIATDTEGRFSKDIPIEEGGLFLVKFKDNRGFISSVSITIEGYTTLPTPTPSISPEIKSVSASATASRESPAYFVVDSRAGDVTISTSTGIDWVIEYVDEESNGETINSQGTLQPEKTTVSSKGGNIYVKTYPVKYTDEEVVTLFALNADSVREDAQAATAFGDIPKETPAQDTPISIVIPILALIILGLSGKRH